MTDKLPPQPFVRQKQQSAPLQEVIGRVPGEIQNVQLDSEGIEESCISKNQDQMKRPRLNLNHGFVRFIQRNQLDRDEYHKMHEQRKTELRKRLGKQVEEAVNGVTGEKEKLLNKFQVLLKFLWKVNHFEILIFCRFHSFELHLQLKDPPVFQKVNFQTSISVVDSFFQLIHRFSKQNPSLNSPKRNPRRTRTFWEGKFVAV